MTEAERLKEQVQRLPPHELARFRAWFVEFDANVWDRKIEADAKSGKLTALLDEARREFESGQSRELSNILRPIDSDSHFTN